MIYKMELKRPPPGYPICIDCALEKGSGMKEKPFPPDSIRILLVELLHGAEIFKNIEQEELAKVIPSSAGKAHRVFLGLRILPRSGVCF